MDRRARDPNRPNSAETGAISWSVPTITAVQSWRHGLLTTPTSTAPRGPPQRTAQSSLGLSQASRAPGRQRTSPGNLWAQARKREVVTYPVPLPEPGTDDAGRAIGDLFFVQAAEVNGTTGATYAPAIVVDRSYFRSPSR